MPSLPTGGVGGLLGLDEIGERLGRVLALAPADETEVTWIESRGGQAASGSPGAAPGTADASDRTPARRTVLVRAREGGRRGAHRTGSGEPGEILAAVRHAVAASRAADPMPAIQMGRGWSVEATSRDAVRGSQEPPREALWDDALAGLDPESAARVLRFRPAPDRAELLTLDWRILRVVVRTSTGLDRRAEATVATLVARSSAGRRDEAAGAGTGFATAAARTLAGLHPTAVLERARERAADRSWRRGAARAEPPGSEAPILFSPEAAAALVAVLVRTAFACSAFESERSPIAGMLGEHVFASEIDLVDDGLDPAGLPFPFDLLGRRKERIDLVAEGIPRTPAVDELLAARLKRRPTPHAVGPEDARPTHPFLRPRRSAEEALGAAERGLWIPGFDGLECFDRGRVAVRGRCLAPRRIRGGELAEPVAPVIWEDSLLRLFSKVRALGGEPVVLAEDGGLGGVSAPMVCVAGAEKIVEARWQSGRPDTSTPRPRADF